MPPRKRRGAEDEVSEEKERRDFYFEEARKTMANRGGGGAPLATACGSSFAAYARRRSLKAALFPRGTEEHARVCVCVARCRNRDGCVVVATYV